MKSQPIGRSPREGERMASGPRWKGSGVYSVSLHTSLAQQGSTLQQLGPLRRHHEEHPVLVIDGATCKFRPDRGRVVMDRDNS